MPKIKPTPFPSEKQVTDAAVLGAAVRSMRTQSGLTIEEAALTIGVAKQTLSDLETGKPTVGLGLALKIAKELGVALFVVPSVDAAGVNRLLGASRHDDA